jgi:hypothetical protein
VGEKKRRGKVEMREVELGVIPHSPKGFKKGCMDRWFLRGLSVHASHNVHLPERSGRVG